MKKVLGAAFILAAAACVGCGGSDGSVTEIRGAGASFPAPLYQRWFSQYSKAHDDVKVEYTSVGSGSGIKQFTQGLVDFGASDAAMTDEEMGKVDKGVQLLPMTAGAIVVCYNLKDADGNPVTELKLSRETYVKIFLGEISRWDDAAIAASNPDLKLPSKPITVVYRSDDSGTTFVFTKHLSEISDAWKNGPGTNKAVAWPVGSGALKNDGVAGAVKDVDGAIGYVEFGYASMNKISMAWLENKSGKFIEPTFESAQSALAAVSNMPEDLRVWLPDPEGEDAYPIVTYTWIMCYKKYDDAKKAQAIKDVLTYCLTDGQSISRELGYVPLPENVVEKVKQALENIEGGSGDEAAAESGA